MSNLSPTQRRQVVDALEHIYQALDPHSPVTNHVLAGVDEIRKALDLDSDPEVDGEGVPYDPALLRPSLLDKRYELDA